MAGSLLPISDASAFDFGKLKLVEKPDAPRNTGRLLAQTLEGCEGYLTALPLKAPNVDRRNPKTITGMVNILTNSEAEARFAEELRNVNNNHNGEDGEVMHRQPEEGAPLSIYDSNTSDLMKALEKNTRSCHIPALFGIVGNTVSPGCAGFYKLDGLTYAVPQGRWFLINPRAYWIAENESLDQDMISFRETISCFGAADQSKVLIVRVPPGSVGCIFDQGVPILLDVGTHVFNSGTVRFEKNVVLAETSYFRHGRYHYVRVPRGQVCLVWAEQVSSDTGSKCLVSRLLREGEHYISSHVFRMDSLVSLNSTNYIQHGTLHCISVQKGCVAKVFQDNVPRLLGEGDHMIESSMFTFVGMEDFIQQSEIVHCTITLIRVARGQIALAWKDSRPIFIDEPGLYEWDSANFKFVKFVNAEDNQIQLGSRKIITVHTGSVGVTYDQGELKILHNGRHVIESSTHVFNRFLSTQQRSIRLATLPARERARKRAEAGKNASGSGQKEDEGACSWESDPDADLTICETKDLVRVGVRADVFYSIEDPEKCINRIDTDELEDLVRETAVATLTNIIRSTALNQIAQSKQVSAGGNAGGLQVFTAPDAAEETKENDANGAGSGSSQPANSLSAFFDKAHDVFLEKLHDDFMFRYGVDIANIRIESFKIMDSELSEQISKGALTTAQIENEMANLEGNSLISTTRERTAAQVRTINAQAEADALSTTTNAANKRKIEAAQAEAEALLIEARAKAESEAQSILVKAKAEAEATRLKAAAEAERAEVLSQTELGKQEALLSLYSNIVIQSNSGVEKVVYMDPSINRDSPFALGSLQNLNRDMHALTHLGIASTSAIAPSISAHGSAPSNNLPAATTSATDAKEPWSIIKGEPDV